MQNHHNALKVYLPLVLWLFAASVLLAQTDTLDSYQKDQYSRYGKEYLRYLEAYNEVKYYTDKDLVKARELLNPLYEASYALLPKTPRYLASYYNIKARIELQSGNQIAASNSFLISIDYFNQEYKLDSRKLSTELSYVFIDLANIYYSLEFYDRAVPYYKEAAAAFSSVNDYLGLSTSLNNIGLVYEQNKQYDSALIYFTGGLNARRKIKNADTCFYFGHSLKYIARIRLEQKDYDSCLAVLKDAEKYTTTTSYYGAKYILVEIYDLFAKCYIERGSPEIGLKYYDQAVKTAGMSYQNQMLCNTFQSAAEYYFNIRNCRLAAQNASKAYELAFSKSFFNERLKAALLLAKIYSYEGSREQALFYITKYDSLSEARKSSIVEAGLAALHESVKRRETIYSHVTENTLLQQRNKTLLFLSLTIFIALAGLGSFFYQKYRIKTRTEKALIKTTDELLRINAVKDRLFSILAHDLRSPFTALIGYSDMLAEDFDGMERIKARNVVSRMQQVSKDTYSLLENLLDWSRIQSDKINCNPVEVKLLEELTPTFSLLSVTANMKNIRLNCDIDKEHTIYADQHMLSTIFRNLISNAVKFSNPDSEILISSVEKDGHIEVSIRDFGVGMDAETINAIISGGSSFTTNGTQQEKGTGLGLMLCKEFIEKNRGSMRIESQPGEGTEFILSFLKKPTD